LRKILLRTTFNVSLNRLGEQIVPQNKMPFSNQSTGKPSFLPGQLEASNLSYQKNV